jgi:hypothetical protein
MLAVQGYYDGTAFQSLEKTMVQQNQRVIITIMDDFLETPTISQAERVRKVEQLCGSLSKYAKPDGVAQEESAWERAAVEKYGDI